MVTMRLRSTESAPNSHVGSRSLGQVSRFDVYTKVHDDFKVKTGSGGLISVVSICLIIVLFVSEFASYLTVEYVDHIIVDTFTDQRLPIGLNMTFPHLRCDEISVDTVDSTGENQVDVAGSLEKIQLDILGFHSPGDYVPKEGECLSCLGAAPTDGEKKCCNSCQELKDAYSELELEYYSVLDTALQCKGSVGCQIHGDVLVHKVSGNVHVALGTSTVKDGKHVHEFNMADVNENFNTSHQFHRLQFGDAILGVESPLEGTTKIVKQGVYMFHYYIKLVPTLSINSKGEKQNTHQYSVTDTDKNVMVKKGELQGLPGVFLVYDFTPFMVQKSIRNVPFSHFITSACAILGGVFTVAGMIDAALYKSVRGFQKRRDDMSG